MSETTPEPSEVTKVARDLSAIEDLACHLETEAIHKANDPDMPGGNAMAALAGVANLEAWQHQLDTAERLWWDGAVENRPEVDDDTWEPPLQTLLFWSEEWRREHDADYDMKHTIVTEVNFLRHLLGWAWENEPHFEDFARDINRARTRLENVLCAGRRTERARVRCIDVECEKKPRLIRVYGRRVVDDRWKCPACKRRYDDHDYTRAKAELLDSEGAGQYVRLQDALGSLERSGRTIRKWLAECRVHAYCDLTTHQVWVWWPDLRRLDLNTPRRQRMSA